MISPLENVRRPDPVREPVCVEVRHLVRIVHASAADGRKPNYAGPGRQFGASYVIARASHARWLPELLPRYGWQVSAETVDDPLIAAPFHLGSNACRVHGRRNTGEQRNSSSGFTTAYKQHLRRHMPIPYGAAARAASDRLQGTHPREANNVEKAAATDVTGALLVHPAATTCGRAVLRRGWDRKSEGFSAHLCLASSTGKERKAAPLLESAGASRERRAVGGRSALDFVHIRRGPLSQRCRRRRRRTLPFRLRPAAAVNGREGPALPGMPLFVDKGQSAHKPSSFLGLPTPAAGEGPSRDSRSYVRAIPRRTRSVNDAGSGPLEQPRQPFSSNNAGLHNSGFSLCGMEPSRQSKPTARMPPRLWWNAASPSPLASVDSRTVPLIRQKRKSRGVALFLQQRVYAQAASASSHGGGGRSPRITEQPVDVVVRKHEPMTLRCGADGDPPPRIAWYHDGRPVRNSATRMVLPEGQLFFLQVQHSRREQDTGLYWCTATNAVGTVRSRNASVELAVLRDEFRQLPKSIHVAGGESATLECVPPRGHPEPTVTWFKDGVQVQPGTGRVRLLAQGALVIADVRPSDQGRYVCRAANMLGTRDSPAALLSVHNVTSLAEESVEFQCKVNGDPKPTVTWRRQDGKMPVGRAYVQEDKSLHIKNVALADEGTYICESENIVGSVSASATLTVHSRPTFRLTPQNQKVGLNGVAKFDCLATGNPPHLPCSGPGKATRLVSLQLCYYFYFSNLYDRLEAICVT
ncbi:hypothetical protein MRX96_004863 [Rhipicephalus microplus]